MHLHLFGPLADQVDNFPDDIRTDMEALQNLYSSKMSSVMSQTKWFFSAHLWSTSALGFLPETNGPLKPDTPATSTLVSPTPRGFRFLAFGGNGDLRNSLFFTIGADGAQNFLFGNLADILCRLS